MQHAKRNTWGWVRRPQVWALTFACLLVSLGLWASPLSLKPSPHIHKIGIDLQAPALPPALSPAVARAPKVDCTAEPCLALTFDDGPDKDFTPTILDTLERHKVRATFFVLGLHAQRHPDLVWREYQAGHEVGNHSWAHADFTKLNPAQIRDEINRTQRTVIDAGVPAPTLFRPPYGTVNDVVLANVPLTIVRWNIDPEDWKVAQPHNITEHTMAHVKPGGVIILHDTEQYTAEALEAMLQQLETRFQFVTVSELFNLPPGQRGVFFGR